MKKPSQLKTDPKALVVKYLRAGKSLEDAATCAGLTEAEASELLNDSDKSLAITGHIANTIAQSALEDSLRIIQDMAMNATEEETRLSAAKELRRFAFDLLKIAKPKESISTVITIEQKDLWDS